MLIVLALMVLLVLVPLAVFTSALGQLPLTRHAVARHSALAAAEAGVTDYLNLLDQNHNYWASPGSNPALTGWEPVPGGGTNEYFTYSVDTATTPETGEVVLTSTGRVGSTVRTVRAILRENSFLDFAYFSIYELPDPTNTNVYPAGQAAKVAEECVADYNQANPSDPGIDGPNWNWSDGSTSCQYLFWGTGDIVNGPAGSDDNFFICGDPVFNGPVTSASISPPVPGATAPFPGWLSTSSPSLGPAAFDCPGGSDPVFDKVPASEGGHIDSGPYLGMPETDASLAQTAAAGGCLYSGQTDIVFNPPASASGAGTMTVSSPNSVLGTASGDTNPDCVGTDVPLPANGVIYVQPVSGGSGGSCAQATNPEGLHFQPEAGDGACAGDLFEQGVVGGQVTTAAENNVYITGSLCNPTDAACVAGQPDPGDTTLTGQDVLGIIANNFVYLYGPTCQAGQDQGVDCTTPENVTVDGAILDLSHALSVENLSHQGVLGTFAVNGTLAEDYADLTGLVGSNGNFENGYPNVINTYDTRLSVLTPPYFLDPVTSAWRQVGFAEVPPPASLPPVS